MTFNNKRLTGYMQFCQVMRSEIREDEPDITFADMGRRLGEMWRELSDEEKQEYS